MGREEGQWKVGGARNECCVHSTSEARGHPRAGSRDKRTRGVGANAAAERAMGTHEVDADGGDVALGVGIVGETEEKARFADAGVTDQLRRRGGGGGKLW